MAQPSRRKFAAGPEPLVQKCPISCARFAPGLFSLTEKNPRRTGCEHRLVGIEVPVVTGIGAELNHGNIAASGSPNRPASKRMNVLEFLYDGRAVGTERGSHK